MVRLRDPATGQNLLTYEEAEQRSRRGSGGPTAGSRRSPVGRNADRGAGSETSGVGGCSGAAGCTAIPQAGGVVRRQSNFSRSKPRTSEHTSPEGRRPAQAHRTLAVSARNRSTGMAALEAETSLPPVASPIRKHLAQRLHGRFVEAHDIAAEPGAGDGRIERAHEGIVARHHVVLAVGERFELPVAAA